MKKSFRGLACLFLAFIPGFALAGEGPPVHGDSDRQSHPVVSAAESTPTDYERACARLQDPARGSDSTRLKQLLEAYWQHTMHEQPENATLNGFPGQDDRWTDYSLPAVARRERECDAPWKTLKTIRREKLSPEDQTSYDVLKWEVGMARAARAFGDDYMPLSQMNGMQQFIPDIFRDMPKNTVKDYENILARLKAIPRLASQTQALLAAGLARGFTFPAVTLRDVPAEIESLYRAPADKSELLEPFSHLPEKLSSTDRARVEELKKEAAKVYEQEVTPALHQLHDYLATTYVPGSRPSDGWSGLPNGKDWYAYEVKQNTTTSLTPDQIHQVGLDEVARVHREMEATMKQAGFQGTVQDFAKKLYSDPKYQFKTKQALLAAYEDLFAKEKNVLPKLFGKYEPKSPLKVMAVPEAIEKSQAPAYYESGSVETNRPGTFFANTYNLPTRTSWNVADMGLHEGIPGHHFQISLAQENKELPSFRKYLTGGYNAYVEGWALYAESLGQELGVYNTPEEKFGRQIADMWRAVRLVVDTGIHADGWSRQQAIDYFRANTPLPDSTIVPEVDRYMVMPGQALSYKMGELKIRELRNYAQNQLGSKFDLPEFHHQVLKDAALPLNVLDKKVRDWVNQQK